MIELNTIREWNCPNCWATATTTEPRPHTQFHTCPGVNGLAAPLVLAGTRCKIVAVEREDYIGKDIVRLDDRGRAVMALLTVRDDGQDAVVFAPTATARA